MRLFPVLIAATMLLTSCPWAEKPALPPGPDDPVKNLAQLDAFANRVQSEGLKTAWKLAMEPESHAKPAPFGVLPLLLLTDDEVEALNRQLEEPQQKQCLQAIHSFAVGLQADSDEGVAGALAGIGSLRQQIPDLSSMFTDENDPVRRKELWFSQAGVAAALEQPLQRLIAARKQWASRRSHTGYLELMRRHRGYDPQTADRLESEVRRSLGSRPIPSIRPWEFEYIDPPLAQRMARTFDAKHCLERASFVFTYLGLPASPPALQVREARQTSFSSFASYPIAPPTDQRVTVRPGAGIVPHWSTFHELGHAAVSLLTAPTSCRTSSRPVSPSVAESCAKIAERFFFSEEWLTTQGLSPADIESLQRWEARSELMRMSSILADIEFERVLYETSGEQLTDQYIAIQSKTARVEVSPDFPAWTLKRHLAFEPLARVDYLLARCAQAAVYRRLRQLPGGLLGDAARQVLRDEVFRGASALRFEEWFRKAAKAEPNCSAWLEDVATVTSYGALRNEP